MVQYHEEYLKGVSCYLEKFRTELPEFQEHEKNLKNELDEVHAYICQWNKENQHLRRNIITSLAALLPFAVGIMGIFGYLTLGILDVVGFPSFGINFFGSFHTGLRHGVDYFKKMIFQLRK